MALGARLRELRTTAFRRSVRQTELAEALDIGNTSISGWENDTKVPGDDRLQKIATFYAAPRSLDPPRVLRDEELDELERSRRDALLEELIMLRGGQDDSPRNPWHFPDGAPVRIICGATDQADRPRFASGLNHNYMALSAYADQDALVELFGHVRSENPLADVQYELAGRLESDDMQAHLVILGNIGWVQHGAISRLASLPVKPVHQKGLDGEVFETVDAMTYGPILAVNDDFTSPVVEDVGFFWRAPSPMNSARTLTVCSGVFTRGVYGAVRLLTDRNLRDHNIRYLRQRFRAPGDGYGLLVRVPVHDHATSTPDLRDEKSRLREFGADSE